MWEEEQRKETQPTQWHVFYEICAALSYAEVRFNSRSKPLSSLMRFWPCVMRVLKRMAADPDANHADDVKLSARVLSMTSGGSG